MGSGSYPNPTRNNSSSSDSCCCRPLAGHRPGWPVAPAAAHVGGAPRDRSWSRSAARGGRRGVRGRESKRGEGFYSRRRRRRKKRRRRRRRRRRKEGERVAPRALGRGGAPATSGMTAYRQQGRRRSGIPEQREWGRVTVCEREREKRERERGFE